MATALQLLGLSCSCLSSHAWCWGAGLALLCGHCPQGSPRTEQFRWKGTSGDLRSIFLPKPGSALWVRALCQLGLENLQGERPHNLSGQPDL